ncbi:MAG: hypothetical protein WAV40_01630 [Microgenomates group bacterium]
MANLPETDAIKAARVRGKAAPKALIPLHRPTAVMSEAVAEARAEVNNQKIEYQYGLIEQFFAVLGRALGKVL